MPRYQFDLATLADDADLRRILAETPTPGRIEVGFRREPSYFAAAVVEGRFRQVLGVREQPSGRFVGLGARSIKPVYVNGRPESVGYLSSLRLLPEHRRRGLLARGFAFLRQVHRDERTPMYLTTIADSNDLALETLTSGRAGLPVYHPAGTLHTLALAPRRRPKSSSPANGIDIRPARRDDLPIVLSFLRSEGPRRQFFPCYEETDFFTADGLLHGLRAEDVLLAFRGQQLVGTLAGWDQQPFRQVSIERYWGPLRWLRPAYNLWAHARSLPRLPGPGELWRCVFAALLVVHEDDPQVFASLLEELLSHVGRSSCDCLLLGLCAGDPLLPVARSFPGSCYTTRLFHVCWQDGETFRQGLDGRPTYLELGSL